jgi:basic amino acid/polyamine antiporter, APA family
MAYSLPNGTWWRLLVWSVIGMVIYLTYGFRNSRLRRGAADNEGSAGA